MGKTIHESRDDYLEAILQLESKIGDGVKAVDLANFLNVSMPAITKAMNLLKADGYIIREVYGTIFLTEAGRVKALEISRLHQLIFTFLVKLGVSSEVAEKDCCKIEHVLSPETITKIEKFIKEQK